MEKHYWKKNELVFLKECYSKYKTDLKNVVCEFQKKYPNIDENQISRVFIEHPWLKE